MGALTILTAYNEIDYMPLKKRWCDANGLDLYVIDNFSNDGTWEWLNDNKVACSRVDTKGAFDLNTLQRATNKVLGEKYPEWVVYIGADTFYVCSTGKLVDYIKNIDGDMIRFGWINMYNTGEEMTVFDPVNTYFFHKQYRTVDFIFKYHPKIYIKGDDIYGRRCKIHQAADLFGFNYGNTKSHQQRMETYERRKKAWAMGLCKAWGVHYREGEKVSWKWSKSELKDIRNTKKFKYIKKLQHDLSGPDI